MTAVLDPTPENVKKVHTLKAKMTNKRRKRSILFNEKKGWYVPKCKKPKTDKA